MGTVEYIGLRSTKFRTLDRTLITIPNGKLADRVERKMVGVVCHEHVGPARVWDSDEETFAYLMSSFVALALERRGGK